MVSVPATLPVSHPLFLTTLAPQARHGSRRLLLPSLPRAQTDTPASSTGGDDEDDSQPSSSSADFDSRLSQVRLKYRSGSGKKAEQRRAKAKKSKSAATLMLPAVPLEEPTAGGAKVELGFTPYSERLNGAVAGLGLAALVLVELGSGMGLLRYHAWPTILIQVYTVAALGAVYVKLQKEKISVWPTTASDDVGE